MQPVHFLSKHFRSFALNFVVVLLVLSSSKALAESKMEEAFLNKIRAAFASHDEQEFWKLFNLDGVGEEVKASLEKHLVKKVVKADLISISLEPLPEDFRTEYVLDGVRYWPNVKPLGLVKMIYKKSKTGNPSTSMLYGQKGNDLMFSGTVGEKLQGDLPASKQIQVIVMGFSHPLVTFEGYMIYLQGNKPVRDKIKDMGGGNVTLIVRGEAITYLEVRRTSPKGEMKVKILEDEDVIFETEQLNGDKPIIFKRTQ